MTTRPDSSLEDQLDELVAEFADRIHAGSTPAVEGFLERVAEEHRPALGRCLRMVQSGIASAPARRPLGPGVVLDGYRIEREVGRGGMATVYLAEEQKLRRMVALKVLRPGLAVDRTHVDRFQREAMAVAKLQHPHIVEIHAVGEADGHHYIAMEYVDGGNMAQVIQSLPENQAWTATHLAAATGARQLNERSRTFESALAELMVPVVRAIAVAHELGMVHRDIKPSNILIHRDGRAKIADFGLAKGSEDPALSLTGEPVGTPYYMSPEQAEMKSHRIDARSDVYSIGVSLYECLSGRRPFEGGSALEVMEAIRTGVPTPLRLRSPKVSRAAEAVVRRAMARRAQDRYATAIDLAADLQALASGQPTQALVQQGGLLRRIFAGLGQVMRGHGLEDVSPRRVLGIPLVHINYKQRRPGERIRVAKGWFAMSDIAIGGVAVAPLGIGGLAFGSLALGLVSIAGMAFGGYAVGGCAAGVMANGGVAAGYLASGGVAIGYYALGGFSVSANPVMTADAAGRMTLDPAAAELFETWMPWVMWILPNTG